MFEIGESVVIADAEYLRKNADNFPSVVNQMFDYAGSECTVKMRECYDYNGPNLYRLSNNGYVWAEDWLLPTGSAVEISEKDFEDLMST